VNKAIVVTGVAFLTGVPMKIVINVEKTRRNCTRGIENCHRGEGI